MSRRYFADKATVGAADEIFLGRLPLMLVVEPRSLLVTGLRLAAGCGAEDWAPVFAALEGLQRCVSDAGEGLVRGVKNAQRHPAFEHLRVLAERLGGFHLGQVGPGREARLGRLVAETVRWRVRDKDPVDALRAASKGTLADQVELAVVEAVDYAVRSSSAVECVNSRVRVVQVARKHLSEDFVYLLAVYHNMRTFGRGSVRKGKTAADLADILLPTSDWIELLELTAASHRKADAKAA
ncbi:MAG TPA: hypothetical protein VNE39_13840 [Planctomycetota bacterium]|nr:hypothetical protein [Planctomycetota bacterium]